MKLLRTTDMSVVAYTVN